MSEAPVVVIGAGEAGLATVQAANGHRVRPLVLEASGEAGGSWPHYYESLTLFSPSPYASLPGHAMPGGGATYPHRDEVAAYLRDYAERLDADFRFGQKVTRVERDGGGFTVTTADGTRHGARALVAASGTFTRPHRPRLPGLDGFTGTVLHSSEYRTPEPFRGQRIVVVGAGNSGVEIAVELARVARVSLASRAPIAWVDQRPLGRDVHWWGAVTGVDSAPVGRLWERVRTPVIDDGRFRAAFATGSPDRRPLFARLSGRRVEWADGTTEEVDTVLLATGYRPALDFLDGTGALDEAGRPLHSGGVSTTVPGLGYVGLEFQRSYSSASLRGVGRDAHRVVRGVLTARRAESGGR
ncbi:putative flavoprotein involved in K+ transport [Nocardiopsis sp. Huas11]|uniref:flavin-containing monooxygenase n=1 Tax=Nocardiopsis sp. Huas11 TaxID=2183912 RepID=UPI000EAD6DFF|nr:FAD-dependent oxidoreductase [Nocardiopsis sp. Huas11]RKS07150.1 putative flavoprotein involved in K+ transport [Nocardiopsis sp. Huas11]